MRRHFVVPSMREDERARGPKPERRLSLLACSALIEVEGRQMRASGDGKQQLVVASVQ